MELKVEVTEASLADVVAVAVNFMDEEITTTTLGDVIVQAMLDRLRADPRWGDLAQKLADAAEVHLHTAAPGYVEALIAKEVKSGHHRSQGGMCMTSPGQRRKAERQHHVRRAARDREKLGFALGSCPACGKQAFTSKTGAELSAGRCFPEAKMRVYQCHDADFWHYTSQDAEVTRRMRVSLAAVRDDAETAAAYVAQVVAGTGTGPTWGQLGSAMGWPAGDVPAIICTLARQGWLRTGRGPRSLRPGPGR